MSMSYVNLEEHLASIAGLPGKEKEAIDVRIALSENPELIGHRLYTGELLLVSEKINQFCTDVEFRNYGNEVVALPYTTDKNVRLHSNPVVFYLGVQNNLGFGIIPFERWDSYFEQYGLDFKIIRKVKSFLESHAPVNYL